MVLVVHEADVQDRDGASRVLASIRSLYPWLRQLFADNGYAGDKLRVALKGNGSWTLQIIKRSDAAKGLEVLPRRMGRREDLRLAWTVPPTRQGLRSTIASAVAWVFVANIRTLTRRIASA